MKTRPETSLQLPSFLHGSQVEVLRQAKAEGRRCAKQYRLDGSLPPPRQLLAVPPQKEVLAHEVVDFQPGAPAFRLYALTHVVMSLCEALDGKDWLHVRDLYEVSSRETAWGALYFAISERAPESAERMALRLKAVLRFWDVLQSGRYLFKRLRAPLTLEELLEAACGWALEAWCPEGGESVRARMEVSAARLARATKEDCIETLLRQLPRILPYAEGLKHPAPIADPAFWRERLATLDADWFERISAASPSWVLQTAYQWDRELDAPS